VWGDGTEWIDEGLPTPNYFYRFRSADGILGDRYALVYLIQGSFFTHKASKYLDDMIRRFIITLPIKERIMYFPTSDTLQHGIVRNLSAFQKLESLPRTKKRNKKFVPKLNQLSARHNSGRFWETKLWIELAIKQNGGEGNPVSYDSLLSATLYNFKWKDKSTCRSFCRNLWKWYENRDWEYHILNFRKSNFTEEEIMANRSTHIIKVHKNRNAKAQAKIKSIIEDIFVQDQIKKKNGSLKISAIAKLVDMNRDTVSKHLKEMGLI